MSLHSEPKKTILSNGVTLLTDIMPDRAQSAVRFDIDKGSRDEKPEENGISHFCEHMMFDGTQSRTYTEIAEQLDQMGGEYNGGTGYDHVNIHNTMPSQYVSESLDLFCDMINNSSFDTKQVEKERQIILREYHILKDDNDECVSDDFSKNAFNGTSIAPDIIGTEENLTSFTADQLRDYYNLSFTAENLIISVVGDFDESAVIKQLENVKFRHGQPTRREYVCPKYNASHGWTVMPSDQMRIITGNTKIKYDLDKDRKLKMLSGILGGGMSSRLFRKIREEMGLCYYIYSSTTNYDYEIEFCISLTIDPKDRDKAIIGISDILSDLKKNGITEQELERQKRTIINHLYMRFDSPKQRANKMISQIRKYGRFIPLSESIDAINGITKADIDECIQEVFQKDDWYTQFLFSEELSTPEWTF